MDGNYHEVIRLELSLSFSKLADINKIKKTELQKIFDKNFIDNVPAGFFDKDDCCPLKSNH